VRPFFDTNVLIYAVLSDDPRCATAERPLTAGGTVSIQVLNEFVNVSRNKLKWSWVNIEAALGLMRGRLGPVREISISIHEAAIVLARDHNVAFYDALIVASAIEAGCDTLFTEDLQHGRSFGGFAIVNPFLENAP
jgi:predicted nucleic acid-binding protein